VAQRLFLSYARPDRGRVNALSSELAARDCVAFFDKLLTGGRSWWDQLLSEIEQCDVFVPVLSTPYLSSEPCEREARYAHALGKSILPIALEDLRPSLLPDFIAELHWLRYAPDDSDPCGDICKALADLGPTRLLPDPLPPRPAIPVSYLTHLKAKLESKAQLSWRNQVVLLSDLKSRLDGPDREPVLLLLKAFRSRRDISEQVARDIDAILAGPVATAAPDPRPARERAVAIRTVDGTIQFDAGTVVLLGREPDNDVVCDNPNVSRRHAEVRHSGADWVLTDLGSTQGVFVDGQRVAQHVIRTGDELVLGLPDRGAVIGFEIIGASLDTRTVIPSDSTLMHLEEQHRARDARGAPAAEPSPSDPAD